MRPLRGCSQVAELAALWGRRSERHARGLDLFKSLNLLLLSVLKNLKIGAGEAAHMFAGLVCDNSRYLH